MESFEFPKGLLERAESITLAQLLDSPVSQCWIVSAMANTHSSMSYHNAKDLTPTDELLSFKLKDLVQSIPYEERQVLFRQCCSVIESKRERAREKAAALEEANVVITE